MTVTNKRDIVVGKTDSFALEVSGWNDGETVTGFTATSEDGLLTIDSTEIESASSDPFRLVFLATAVSEGYAMVTLEWETATRSRCETMRIKVEASCD